MARAAPSSTSLGPITSEAGHLKGESSGDIFASEAAGCDVGNGGGLRMNGVDVGLSGSDGSTPQAGGGGASSGELPAPAWTDTLTALAGRSTPFNPVFQINSSPLGSTTNGASFAQLPQAEYTSTQPVGAPSTSSSSDSPTSNQNQSHDSFHSHTHSNSSGSTSDLQPMLGLEVSLFPLIPSQTPPTRSPSSIHPLADLCFFRSPSVLRTSTDLTVGAGNDGFGVPSRAARELKRNPKLGDRPPQGYHQPPLHSLDRAAVFDQAGQSAAT